MRFILWKFQDIYIDEVCRFIPPYLYNPKSINLELKIQLFQKKISYNLRRIIDMINIDFINTFC